MSQLAYEGIAGLDFVREGNRDDTHLAHGTCLIHWRLAGSLSNPIAARGAGRGFLRARQQAAADPLGCPHQADLQQLAAAPDRKSTRLNSSHVAISYAVFCLKKKTRPITNVLIYIISHHII